MENSLVKRTFFKLKSTREKTEVLVETCDDEVRRRRELSHGRKDKLDDLEA